RGLLDLFEGLLLELDLRAGLLLEGLDGLVPGLAHRTVGTLVVPELERLSVAVVASRGGAAGEGYACGGQGGECRQRLHPAVGVCHRRHSFCLVARRAGNFFGFFSCGEGDDHRSASTKRMLSRSASVGSVRVRADRTGCSVLGWDE